MNKILIIDNYDSFVYNIVQYIGELDKEAKISVFRNDKIGIEKIKELSPTHIIISPGPKRPEDAGESLNIIKEFAGKIPILGVCLGHQAIGYAFGGRIIHAPRIMHGKTSYIRHYNDLLFENIQNPFLATRYHSLVIEKESFPDVLKITAISEDDNQIMAIEHKEYTVFGVQFHPESFLTESGKKMLKNFLEVREGKKDRLKLRQKIKSPTFKELLNKVVNRGDLSYGEASYVMELIMEGKLTNTQIGGFLTALRTKGETEDEFSAMAKVMQEKATKINKVFENTGDTCGTGGDGAGTFNISTTTSFVVSAGGVPVAKHGNRAISGKVGSADLLEAAGYIFKKDPSKIEEELRATKFTFLFAPFFHPSMKNVMPARRELGIRTVFNMLGPIINPALVKYQIIGVFDFSIAHKVARALQVLGTERALVLSGGFTDELTTCEKNMALLVTKKEVIPMEIEAKELGLSPGQREELRGKEDPKSALKHVKAILKGEAGKTEIQTIALNAGAMFWIAKDTPTLKDGIEKALDIILSKKAFMKFQEVMEYQYA